MENVFMILIIIIVIIVLIYRLPEQKGKQGEKRVNNVLENMNGYLFKNYLIIDENHNSHQIDTIFVNNTGVYVIETKNYGGLIYGREEQMQWTQVLKYGKVRNVFYNPVKQNKSHCYCIKNILPRNIDVISLVVFVQNNANNIKSKIVVNLSDLKTTISHNPYILTDMQIKNVVNILEVKRNSKYKTEDHVRNIKMMKKKIDNNICPRCGGRLVLRKGPYGYFFGCENYPKCTFVKHK